jgi:hypothetical protein
MAARFYEFLGQNSTLINIIESKYLTIIMLIVVISNTFVMIFETYDLQYQKYNSFFLITEKIYLCIYIIECSLKLWVDYNEIFSYYLIITLILLFINLKTLSKFICFCTFVNTFRSVQLKFMYKLSTIISKEKSSSFHIN